MSGRVMLFKNIKSSWTNSKTEIILLNLIVFILKDKFKVTFPGPGFLCNCGIR